MADGEARHRPRVRLPARAAGVAPRGVEAQPGHGHERVAGVGVDRHPAPGAGPPEVRQRGGVHRAVQEPGRRQREGDRARAVVGGVDERLVGQAPMAAAVDVGLARDGVGGVDDGRHARRRGRRDGGQASGAQPGGVDRPSRPRPEGLLELAPDLGVGRGSAAAARARLGGLLRRCPRGRAGRARGLPCGPRAPRLRRRDVRRPRPPLGNLVHLGGAAAGGHQGGDAGGDRDAAAHAPEYGGHKGVCALTHRGPAKG